MLSRYCGEHRATDLYILGVDDEFYSAVLPLHRVRYGWIDATDMVEREHPHLAYLGILIPAAEFPQLQAQLPLYRDRLHAWGLDSTQAVATGLSAHDIPSLVRLIHDHPESDFLVARTILPDPEHTASHRVAAANTETSRSWNRTSLSRPKRRRGRVKCDQTYSCSFAFIAVGCSTSISSDIGNQSRNIHIHPAPRPPTSAG